MTVKNIVWLNKFSRLIFKKQILIQKYIGIKSNSIIKFNSQSTQCWMMKLKK